MTGLMTELEAVNAVLSIAGDAPVSSLDSGYAQAITARTILNRISREEQTKGLWFNEDSDRVLVPNLSGEIQLPATAITVSVNDGYGELVQRGRRLYDRDNQTYIINKEVKASLIEFLDWEILPQSFRQYVTALAQKEYNNEYFGSQDVERVVERKIAAMFIMMRTEDVKNRNINLVRTARSSNIAFYNRR